MDFENNMSDQVTTTIELANRGLGNRLSNLIDRYAWDRIRSPQEVQTRGFHLFMAFSYLILAAFSLRGE